MLPKAKNAFAQKNSNFLKFSYFCINITNIYKIYAYFYSFS
ncbi:hypothetical protein HMPREF9554_02316 [Treponema phagedenis F0421]|nr:hypothetical protein HMPREF9554_02316 [Treponema phagedenis F0421]